MNNLVLFPVLRIVKNDLLQALKNCEDPSCKEIESKYKIGELDSNGIDYDLVNMVVLEWFCDDSCGLLVINSVFVVDGLLTRCFFLSLMQRIKDA